MDELILEFLTETNESLGEVDGQMVELERDPNNIELLSNIFRLVHTIKGTCGFLGLSRLEKVAHHAENVLGKFRDGDLEVTPEYVTLIFESIDRIKMILSELEETGSEPEGDDTALIAKLDAVYEGAVAKEDTPPPPPVEEKKEEKVVGMATEEELEAAFANAKGPDELEAEAKAAEEEAKKAAEAAKKDKAKKNNSKAAPKESSVAAQSLRVNVDVLENLMTMVSELVLTRNQLLQILRTQKESEFGTPLQRLNHVVSELQEGVMKTRMQPIGNAWAKLPRIIRDLSIELGKKIDLEMKGKDTELDRQVLDMIKDPLTHMVRNSGDHGIELPEDRVKAGKPETGKIKLEAYHEGGHIIIKISDDGKGLSLDKIKEKAVANGLATEEELETMPSQSIYQFIFKAGFSTAEQVTAVSGRGVGMDVVRTNIEKIGGSIELTSQEGKGSTFTIKIPLTLAIVSALIVESAGERFAIPQLAVRELVMASEQSEYQIEKINNAPVLRLRDHLLPLVSLKNLMKLESPTQNCEVEAEVEEQETSDCTDSEHRYIVVTQVGSYSFGIIVDRVFDTEEIVVKPVSNILKDIEMFSGNTILGDGSVIMILDPAGIAKTTGKSDTSEGADSKKEEDILGSRELEKTTLLLFAAGDKAPKTVPLALVSRLESIKVSDIEYANGQMLIQYRGKLMQLLPFSSDYDVNALEGEDRPVLVFTDNDRAMGLLVDEIIDIVEEHIDVEIAGNSDGIMGSAIISGKATDVIDVGYYIRKNNKDWYKNHGDEAFGSNEEEKRKILLVDDSPFFRNMLTPLLSVAGYDVTTLDSPIAALEMCEKGAQFDVIVSDIEMPEMNGFEFAEKVKSGSNWQQTPMVALTSHATPEDMDRGSSVGFNEYIAKFDRDTLLDTISKTLSQKGGE